MPALAQLPNVTPEHTHQALLLAVAAVLALSSLCSIVFGALSLRNSRAALQQCQRREISPQPLDVKLVEGFVTKEDCKKEIQHAAAEIVSLRDCMDTIASKVDEHEVYGKDRRQQIYEELKKVREDFLAADAKIYERLERLQTEINANMQSMPDRIIALMRNTGMIRPRP